MRKKTILALFLLSCFFVLPSLSLAAEQGPRIPAVKGYDLNGAPYDLQPSIGSKPIMLVFWASWCPSCKTEVPKINQLAEKFHQKGMEFVGINVGFNDSVERAQAFVKKTGMSYPVLFDAAGKITDQFKLQGVPTIIIADKHGIIRFRNYAAPEITDTNFAELMAD